MRMRDFRVRFAHEPDSLARPLRQYRDASHAADRFVASALESGAIVMADLPLDVIVRCGRRRKALRFRCEPDVNIEALRTCRKCGCTDDDACEEGCSWVGADLCSACV